MESHPISVNMSLLPYELWAMSKAEQDTKPAKHIWIPIGQGLIAEYAVFLLCRSTSEIHGRVYYTILVFSSIINNEITPCFFPLLFLLCVVVCARVCILGIHEWLLPILNGSFDIKRGGLQLTSSVTQPWYPLEVSH